MTKMDDSMIQTWFAKTIPNFIKELESCISNTRNLTTQSNPVTLAISSQNSSKLKGFVTLSNTCITKGLTFKSSNYNRGNPVKFVLDSTKAIDMTQLKMVHDCLSMALTIASRLDPMVIHSIVDSLSHITLLAQQALISLSDQDPLSIFPISHFPHLTNAPPDCAVDFGIQDINLIVTITCFVPPDSNPLEQALSTLKQSNTVRYQGKDVSILDKVIVETCFPTLVKIKQGLGTISALCEDFINKYNVMH
ncbi:hypothetical protein BC833DRAFT_592614 [Globomyces pollinis-pini]|nr:hypothetical protein BC833DRAFT_592614 [Globomyces pollinis-pini]